MPFDRTAATAGDHIDWMITSPDAIRYANYVDYGKRWMQLFAETAGPAALARALAGSPGRPGGPGRTGGAAFGQQVQGAVGQAGLSAG